MTSNSITVGTISTQTGPISSNFSSLIYGEKAYFDYINAQGGINGRKINYQYTLDDGGNPSQFTQLANTLINQDHVFAVTGVGTAFFTPNIFVESKTPTYGYNVTENWNGPPNLFAAGGSVIYTPAEAPGAAYVARTAKATKVAIVAYGDRLVGGRLPGRGDRPPGRWYTGRLHRLQDRLPRDHRGHRRAAHAAGRRQLRTDLHGRAGQHHHGPGHPAVRAEGVTSSGSTATTSRPSIRTRA